MTDTPDARITKNIDLAFRFLEEVIEEPARADTLPERATLFLLPPDDPGFNQEQMVLAQMAATTGKETFIWRLGAPKGEQPAVPVRSITPRWPRAGIDPIAVYDRDSDILVVDFFNGTRRGEIEIGTREFGVLLVDSDTEEIVVNVVPRFLSANLAMTSSTPNSSIAGR
jgi:hypothetical protein